MTSSQLYNPHIEGEPFLWQSGKTGVLLLHGLTATPAEVIPLGRVLHAAGYTVMGPLLPGHGTTPADLNRVHWRDWVATAEGAYRQLTDMCDRVVVGGESTGAVLALWLAATHPDAAAVLAFAPALKLALSRWDVWRTYLAAPFVAAVPKPGLGGPGSDLWQGYPVNPLRGIIQLFGLQKAVRPRLKDVHQPLLLVEGANDKTIAGECVPVIRAAVQSQVVETHILPQSSHVVILDKEREQAFAITLKFLARVLGERSG